MWTPGLGPVSGPGCPQEPCICTAQSWWFSPTQLQELSQDLVEGPRATLEDAHWMWLTVASGEKRSLDCGSLGKVPTYENLPWFGRGPQALVFNGLKV